MLGLSATDGNNFSQRLRFFLLFSWYALPNDARLEKILNFSKIYAVKTAKRKDIKIDGAAKGPDNRQRNCKDMSQYGMTILTCLEAGYRKSFANAFVDCRRLSVESRSFDMGLATMGKVNL